MKGMEERERVREGGREGRGGGEGGRGGGEGREGGKGKEEGREKPVDSLQRPHLTSSLVPRPPPF